MRICHVIESSGSGSGRVVTDLARYCCAAGDDVTVIYSPARAEAIFVEALNAIPGVNVFTLPMAREVGWRDAVAALRLAVLLWRAGPFDVLHGHCSKGGALARIAGLFMPRAVRVYTPHAFVTMAPDANPAYARIEQKLSLISDAIITVSAGEERHAIEHLKIAPHRLITIVNGIDANVLPNRDGARKSAGFDDNAFVIGYVGRLALQKNPARLVEVFAAVAAKRPEARLVIMGAGPLLDETAAALDRQGLKEKVQIFTDRDAREFIPGFDCLLCTSDYEGFPVTFLEAMAAGVPVVTTPVGGAEEAAGNNEAGVVVSDFSAKSLAEAVEGLIIMKPQERACLQDNARRRAKQFDVTIMGRKTRALYESLNNRRS